MSYRLTAGRTVPVVLGLIVVLLADSLAVRPAQVVSAATDGGTDTSAAAGARGQVTRDVLACANGFDDIRGRADMSLLGVTFTGAGAVAVGFTRTRDDQGSRRRPASLYTKSGRWFRSFVPNPGVEDGLVAVAPSMDKQAWAVGFTTAAGRAQPLAMRWDGDQWRVNRPRTRGDLDSMLTDVAVVSERFPLAVGYRLTASGKRKPIAARRDKKRWRYIDPPARRRESITLTGVSRDRRGGVWAVGHGGKGAVVRPVVYRRTNKRWKRIGVPRFSGEAVLTDVIATARDNAWAVGYERESGHTQPLVLNWNGKRWRRQTPPRFDSPDTILSAVSAPASGGLWVVGSGWREAVNRHESVAAWWDGQSWSAVTGPEAGDELRDVVGSLHNGGWAVGRSGPDARTTRVCSRPQTSIFGGSEPVDPADTTTAEGPAPTAVLASQALDGLDVTIDEDIARTPIEETARGSIETGKSGDRAKKRKRGKNSRKKQRRGPQPLPVARSDSRILARNVAFSAGVAGHINSYGAIAADFDGDGDDDLYIGAHGKPARLAINEGGRFVDHPTMRFPQIDRHGCAAADVDGSGLLDLYCTIGGKRGSGLKANELWIDPAGPAPVDIAAEAGIADSTGRGRLGVFLGQGEGKPLDLLVANSPARVDGLPSLGRRFRVGRDGTFSPRPKVGFAPHLGALKMQAADMDSDGREDMLLVTGGLEAPKSKGTRLYRNTRNGLVDVTRKTGIRPFKEIDAKLVDLNGDRHLDLVQLSEKRLRISIFNKGKFRKVYSRVLTHGRSITGGDADGDGLDDLYVVRGNSVRNPSDVMLINRRKGTAFSSVTLPQTSSGDADEAVAIDHDDNGLTDFLVLNGGSQKGPTQLVAFYRRSVARSP